MKEDIKRIKEEMILLKKENNPHIIYECIEDLRKKLGSMSLMNDGIINHIGEIEISCGYANSTSNLTKYAAEMENVRKYMKILVSDICEAFIEK